tara:strand:+ start:652 stop:1347 length:696 start_codon:yes stop_codon:yes gene_type:complete
MPDFFDSLQGAWGGPLALKPLDLILSLTCALFCGFIISETYRRTHRGVDYSRPFVQVLILCSLIVAFVTLIVGDDLARAFTLVGALSVIRFRTAVKEARDLAFIFWCVAAGMGAGCRFLTLTILFTLVVTLVVVLFVAAGYGVRDPGLKVLRLRLESSANYENVLTDCFRAHLADQRRLSVSLVRQGLLNELVYLIRLKRPDREREFLEEVRQVVGDQPVTLSGRDGDTAF